MVMCLIGDNMHTSWLNRPPRPEPIIDPDTVPPCRDYPFRLVAGVLEQFYRRNMAWRTVQGYSCLGGYLYTSWSLGDGTMRRIGIHRIIYTLAHGTIPAGYDVDHIDGNQLNNHPDNLRACTHHTNIMEGLQRRQEAGIEPHRRDYKPRLTPERRVELMAGERSLRSMAIEWELSEGYLSNERSKTNNPKPKIGIDQLMEEYERAMTTRQK